MAKTNILNIDIEAGMTYESYALLYLEMKTPNVSYHMTAELNKNNIILFAILPKNTEFLPIKNKRIKK